VADRLSVQLEEAPAVALWVDAARGGDDARTSL